MPPRQNLTHDLVLPTLLFTALGGMSWAVRGCSGYGAVPGCVFAGVTWGTAWWYLARDPAGQQSRRYSSGWVVLALTLGIGLAGAQGWMQWANFFEGKLYTNYGAQEFVPISKSYGAVWYFIAGFKWAALGACLLAWCGSLPETRLSHWVIRLSCAFGMATLFYATYRALPQFTLPLYDSLAGQYANLPENPGLKKLIRDGGEAMHHLGFCVGCLVYECARRDWKNVVLILVVGTVNGCGWALCQCWKWAPHLWPDASFNWWRCWESSGGISIGLALGAGYFLVNRPMSDTERQAVQTRNDTAGPYVEWLLVYLALCWIVFLHIGFRPGDWGRTYFGVLMVFGAAYCLRHGSDRDDADRVIVSSRNGRAFVVCVTVIYLLGLLIPFERFADLGAGFGIIAMVGSILVFRQLFGEKNSSFADASSLHMAADRTLERFGLHLGLLLGLGISIQSGLKGWFNLYRGDEAQWNTALWEYLGPVYLFVLLVAVLTALWKPLPIGFRGNTFPRACGIMWMVLLVQNVLAQLVTGPPTAWTEVVFSVYYILLFAITAVIVIHSCSTEKDYGNLVPSEIKQSVE